jgi:hypothetical protein
VLFTWRNFAGFADLISSLASILIVVTGLAATAALLAQNLWGGAVAAFVLTFAFLGLVVLVAPRVIVTLYDAEAASVFTIRQTSKVPGSWIVVAPSGERIGSIRRSLLRRFIPERWTIASPQERDLAFFRNVSPGRAILRKLTLDFAAAGDLVFVVGRETTGRVVRNEGRSAHRLEVARHRIDSRLTLAAVMLILTGDL